MNILTIIAIENYLLKYKKVLVSNFLSLSKNIILIILELWVFKEIFLETFNKHTFVLN